MMTELEKLQAEHAAMGETIARLQAEANKAAEPNKAGTMMPANDGRTFWYISAVPEGYVALEGYSALAVKYVYSPKFRTQEHAEAIAFARSIEDQMRAQPGCVVAVDVVEQWVVRFDDEDCEPVACFDNCLDTKLDHGQWGVFDTRENCEAAIRTVGAENLIRAAKAKVGMY